MTLTETLQTTDILRRYTGCFERCMKAGKDIEARTYLPNIKKPVKIWVWIGVSSWEPKMRGFFSAQHRLKDWLRINEIEINAYSTFGNSVVVLVRCAG